MYEDLTDSFKYQFFLFSSQCKSYARVKIILQFIGIKVCLCVYVSLFLKKLNVLLHFKYRSVDLNKLQISLYILYKILPHKIEDLLVIMWMCTLMILIWKQYWLSTRFFSVTALFPSLTSFDFMWFNPIWC